MSSRRGFLRLIGAAPIALPVAAKEAAASMGLSGPLNAAAASYGLSGGVRCVPAGPSRSYLLQQIAELYSPAKQAEYRSNAKSQARILDPDIAALRSISPAQAYQMQVDRVAARMIEMERSWLEQRLRTAAGI